MHEVDFLTWTLAIGIPLLPYHLVLFPIFSWWYCIIYATYRPYGYTAEEAWGRCIFNPELMTVTWAMVNSNEMLGGIN